MAAKPSAGSIGNSGTSAICRRSASATMAISRSSREPKWCNSIRWLVPTAAATSRSERSPIPPLANSSNSASSSCRRRVRSGVRAIGAAELLRPGLEALSLLLQEAPGLADHQPAHQRAEEAALVEFLAYQGAATGPSGHIVASADVHAGGALHPGPRRSWLDVGDLPGQLGHAGLFDREASADGKGRTVPPDKGCHR